MIRPTTDLKHIPTAVRTTAAQGSARSGSSFLDVFRSSEQTRKTSASAASPSRQAAATVQTTSAALAPKAATAAEPAVSANSAINDSSDMPPAFTPAGVEAHMNQWLMGFLQKLNESRTAQYNLAVEGWKNNNARNRELGIPEVPPPPPPELAEIAPMPPGWWRQTHSEETA